METFIKNTRILEETVSDEDLLDFGIQIETFSRKIDNMKQSGLIGLVADFGKGKSTLIHQVKTRRDTKKERWIDFEAWDMPDRKELWEGLVLEIARQIDSKSFREARSSIDGKQHEDKRTLVNTLGDIPGLAVIKNLNHFLDTSPARRVFEIQEILEDLINKKCKEELIVIVAEDIDRSGPNGIFLVETLKSFLRTSELSKKVVVLVPISEKSFFDNQESYLKCLDVVEFLDLSRIKLKKFFQAVLDDSISANPQYIELISQFFEYLMIHYPDTTLRKVKLILRKADITYRMQSQSGLEPDWRMTIVFEAMKFFKQEKTSLTYFDDFKRRGVVTRDNIFGSFLQVVYSQSKNMRSGLYDRDNKLLHPKVDFKFTDRKEEPDAIRKWPSVPWYSEWSDEKTFWMTDFYLKY